MDTGSIHNLLRSDYHDVRPSARYVNLTGEADLATAKQLEHDLRRLLSPSWVTHLALDMTALRVLDCAALSALLTVRKSGSERGQQMTITAAVGMPARVLALTGVGPLFGLPAPRTPNRRESGGPRSRPASGKGPHRDTSAQLTA